MNTRINKLYSLLGERILILDGAIGTMIQRHNLTEADFRGKRFKNHSHNLKGNNDILCLTKPDIIKQIHKEYLLAGADIIETNTFNSNKISQADYKTEDLVYEINFKAAKLARKVSQEFSEIKFVAGSIGPSNKMLSIPPDVKNSAFRNILFDDVVEAYTPQIQGLLDGGVDILLVETVFDILMAKAIIYTIETEMQKRKITVPIMISGTIDKSGKLISGQTTDAFVKAFSNNNLLSIGLNCSLGSRKMFPFLEQMAKNTYIPICVYPNAGLPNELGEYDETPEKMAIELKKITATNLINIIGGCCGTTPEHIRKIAEVSKNNIPKKWISAPNRRIGE